MSKKQELRNRNQYDRNDQALPEGLLVTTGFRDLLFRGNLQAAKYIKIPGPIIRFCRASYYHSAIYSIHPNILLNFQGPRF